jgi:hypothetical protein
MEELEIRMKIKALVHEAREKYPDFIALGDVDAEDILIEALIHPDKFEARIRLREA